MSESVAFDSRPDTWDHIDKVRSNIARCVANLEHRADHHDRTKLEEPEKSAYDRAVPEMRKHHYGTPEHKAATKLLGSALGHHFEHNSHHPEHYGEAGILGMTLMAVLEMVCDWKAAASRPPGDGTVRLDISAKRFGIGPQLLTIIRNTIDYLECTA